jgi:hypothetical protein
MPFLLLFIGVALVVSAIQGTIDQFGTLIKNDFTGKGNFLYWMVAILIVGSVGYVSSLRKVSDTFMALLIIVLIIANDKQGGGGFFAKLTQALNSNQSASPSQASATDPNDVTLELGSSSSSSGGSSGGSGSLLSTGVGLVEDYYTGGLA